MQPESVAAALSAALAAAACVALSWWLGVWGWLATIRARVRVLEMHREGEDAGVLRRLDAVEARIEGMRRRLSGEDGQVGRAKQREQREAAERAQAELAAAAREQPEDPLVQKAIAADLSALPPWKGRRRPMRALVNGPQPDVLSEEDDGQTTPPAA